MHDQSCITVRVGDQGWYCRFDEFWWSRLNTVNFFICGYILMMIIYFQTAKTATCYMWLCVFLLGAKMSCFCCVFWGQTSHFVWFLVNSLDSADGIARLCLSKLPSFRVLVYFLVGILILSWFEFFKSTLLSCFFSEVMEFEGFCSPFHGNCLSFVFFVCFGLVATNFCKTGAKAVKT